MVLYHHLLMKLFLCACYVGRLSNAAMKLARMRVHWERIHSDKMNKDFEG